MNAITDTRPASDTPALTLYGERDLLSVSAAHLGIVGLSIGPLGARTFVTLTRAEAWSLGEALIRAAGPRP